jgi:mannan endo-1,4-beta-mannosidase
MDEIGAHIKSISRAKLVGTGEEGFESSYQGYDERFWRYAGPKLFEDAGHFQKNLESPYIDFGSIHFFPESWNIPTEQIASAGARWLNEHARAASRVGKPVVLGEFGLRNDGAFTLSERRAMYSGWLTCAHRTGLAAVAPWVFAYDARPEWDRHTFYFRDGTEPDDPQNRYVDIIIRAAEQSEAGAH